MREPAAFALAARADSQGDLGNGVGRDEIERAAANVCGVVIVVGLVGHLI